MNARSLRRLWPQKVRTRLTLIYAAPFLVAGLAVFGLALFVLQKSYPAHQPYRDLDRQRQDVGLRGAALSGVYHDEHFPV